MEKIKATVEFGQNGTTFCIIGTADLKNGRIFRWEKYITADTLEEAKAEAIRLVSAAWKGAIRSVYITGNN